ncbi:peptidase family M48-domain-containing protein [Russula earlei]|uniref:Peptidase family M48-domain-containing protein n=1 Tax=Russula earlei TaxID=71964 RepID=A0ACC0TSH0_9AGAM|nr:peptidase family M48-domain-containing protein [Russula earlei]
MDFLHDQLAVIQHRLAFVQEDPIDWKVYVLAFTWGVCIFESYLLLRQYPLYSKVAPPAVLADHFTLEVFEKSQKYGKHKARFSIVSGLYRQFITTIELASGFYYPWIWRTSGRLLGLAGYGPEYLISQSVVFVFVLVFAATIPTLPLGLYQTFVLEEQHGFNKTTLSLYFADMLKSWVLGIVIGSPLLAAFLYVFDWAGDRFVPWVMMLLIVFQLLMVVLYPTIIQPFFNKLSPLPEGELRTRIETLASKLKFPLDNLYEIDGSKRSSHSNAYFFGLPWRKHIVIFDTLIQHSPPDEVEAVVAHELGHWYHLHPTKLLLVTQFHLLCVLAMFPAFLNAPPLLRSFGFPESVAARPPPILAFFLYQMVLSPIEALVMLALNAISRRFEYQADRFACELSATVQVQSAAEKEEMKDMGTRLGRALVTLHVKNLSTVWVDWLYSTYHHSHPTLTERLKALGEHGSEGLGTTETKKEK